MATPTFCIEITGEGLIHSFFAQSGYSGKDYRFFKNRETNSYLRAYPDFQDYMKERDDMHTTNGVWALKANIHPSDKIDPACFVGGKPKQQEQPEGQKKSR